MLLRKPRNQYITPFGKSSFAHSRQLPSCPSPDMEKEQDEVIFSSSVGVRDEEVLKRAWRKVDLHIMPVAVLLYLASYIDRHAACSIARRMES